MIRKILTPRVKSEIASIAMILLVIFCIRVFIASPYKIPSESMLPNLLINDFILTTKWDYNIKIPFTPISIKTSIPRRGDVVLFDYPKDPNITFIRRMVGLPGDKISVVYGELSINGEKVSQYLGGDGYLEKIGDVEHRLNIISSSSPNFSVEVPENSYFVLGDNRMGSADSRFWGFVPHENLIGKARFIWFSYDGFSLRIKRMFKSII